MKQNSAKNKSVQCCAVAEMTHLVKVLAAGACVQSWNPSKCEKREPVWQKLFSALLTCMVCDAYTYTSPTYMYVLNNN